MRKATWEDKDLIIDIFSQTFVNNPGTTWVLRKNLNLKKGIKRMARYAFVKGFVKDGVYLSDNELGVAICYKYNNTRFSFREILAEIVFTITALNIRKIPAILSRESYRKSQRPASGEYLYYWFLGVKSGGERAALELGLGILELADKLNLPVYVETAVERIKPVYERYGFNTFHYWEDKERGIRFWFLKREPHTSMKPRTV